MGKTPEDLAKSVFIEKLHARGYEVLLLNESLDEICELYLSIVSCLRSKQLPVVQNVRQYKKFQFQDVAKSGMKFGDEGMVPTMTA
jgi:heat shock protein beta